MVPRHENGQLWETPGLTLPKLFVEAYEKYGANRVAMRNKEFGIWREYKWEEVFRVVKCISYGLTSLGMEHGDRICIIGDNEPQWYWAEYAIQAMGGIVSGLFVDSIPSEVMYIIQHSEAKFVFAKDQEQVDKIFEIRDKIPLVRKVIYWDPKGMWSYHDPFVMSMDDLIEVGKAFEASHSGLFESSVTEGKTDDIAVICYTSGTTGLPKGVMISHGNLLAGGGLMLEVNPWFDTDDYLSYVPLAWMGEQFFGITSGLLSGAIINFPEEPETLQEDLRDIGPQVLLYSSRLWESLCSTIQYKLETSTILKQLLFKVCIPVGYKFADMELGKRKPNLVWKILYNIANLIIFRALRDKHGLSRVRTAVTGGAAISPDIFKFFRAIGLELVNEYGTTEACLISAQRQGETRAESVGLPVRRTDLKLSNDGEIIVRGPQVFKGYYKDEEQTKKVLRDGWLHTGDAGYIDADGHLIYLDRLSDLMELASGEKYPPQYIEGRLKFSQYIKDVIVTSGEERTYVSALIQIDYDIAGNWAEKHHINYTTYADLSQQKRIYDLIEKEVGKVNSTLPAGARVRKFVLLNKELDPDEGELSRSRKLRRKFVEEKFKDLLRSIYQEKTTFELFTEVKYRDGRSDVIKGEMAIRAAE